jgi:hypothetical protein
MTLGLSTFCHDTDQPACDWSPDLTGVHDAGPHVAGVPLAAPRSWAARLINDSASCSAIELITYTTPGDDGYRVHLLVLWCTWDPATLEITWSADRTWDMRDPWPTRQAAAFVADQCAWDMASAYGRLVMALGQFSHETFAPVLGWDGQPFQDGDDR